MTDPVRLFVQNGLGAKEFQRDVIDINANDINFELVSCARNAEVIVFGPYGKDIPPPGPYIRVAYMCENVRYDGPNCEFLFRVPWLNRSNFPSARIQWHGLDPIRLIKSVDRDIDAIIAEKVRFCAFLYSNSIPYREMLFRELSKYKRIDAPGRSMNNFPNIDSDALSGEDRWQTKRSFLRKYKFTIAFENEIFSGYQTEKLTDAMLSDSIPIYIGDRNVASIFDDRSFINMSSGEVGYWVSRLEDFSQLKWFEIVGPRRDKFDVRVLRKLKRFARDVRHLYFARKICAALVDRVVELDRDIDKYREIQRVPWLKDNAVPEESYSRDAWLHIFRMARQRRLFDDRISDHSML